MKRNSFLIIAGLACVATWGRRSSSVHDQFETKCTPLCAASATRQHEGQARLRASRLVMTLTTRLERLTSACTRRAVLGRAVLSDALCYTRRQPATLPLRPPPSPRCREREPPIPQPPLPQPPLPRPAPLPLRPRSPSQAEVAISGRGRHLGQQELGELHTALREPDVDLGCVELLLRVRLCRRDAER